MAGFIMKKEQWLNIVETQGLDTTVKRAKYILKTFANLLLQTGTGWKLDDTRGNPSPTVDDLYEPVTNRAWILYLISKSGAKLMLGYSLYGVKFSKPWSYANDLWMDGLFFSMIPAESTSVFGTTYGRDDFIPLDATWPMAHNMLSQSSQPSTSNSMSAASNNIASFTYRAGVLTDGDIILFRFWHDGQYGNLTMIGPIIKTLAHPSMDTLPTRNMLVWRFTHSSGETCYEASSTESSNSSYVPSFYGLVSIGSATSYYPARKCDLFRADGEHLQNFGSNIFLTGLTGLTGTNVANATVTGFYRWVALCIGITSSDPTSTYIVRGDGFKGYLDTDFIRYTSTSGRLDDGNFYGFGSGFAFGWDPTNENW